MWLINFPGNSGDCILKSQSGTYPLGIFPTTSMLYRAESPQKWMIIVAAMIWRKKQVDGVNYYMQKGETVPECSLISVMKVPPAGLSGEHSPRWALWGSAWAASVCSSRWFLSLWWEQWAPPGWPPAPALRSAAAAGIYPPESVRNRGGENPYCDGVFLHLCIGTDIWHLTDAGRCAKVKPIYECAESLT